MYFGTKSYLKSTRNHTVKHALYILTWIVNEIYKKFNNILNMSE
jgi:hypothetical protein